MATLIVKLTERCNGACAYCDVIRRAGASPRDLSLELLDALLETVDRHLRVHRRETVDLIWHGGEPLLRGTAFFRELTALLRSRCPDTRPRIRQFMQSNLSLLDRPLARALRELGLSSIGASYEPLPGIRRWRGEGGEEGLRRRFLRSLAILEGEGMTWGMIHVITRPALSRAEALYRHLVNLCPGGAVTFNPVLLYEGRCPELAVTDGETATFLLEILGYWWPERHRHPLLQPFSGLLAALEGRGAGASCSASGCCAGSHLNVDPAGRLSLCGRAADFDLVDLGELDGRSLDEIFASEALQPFHERDEALREGDCADCRLFPLCHGGCPLDAHEATGSFTRRSPRCTVTRRLVEEGLEPRLGHRYGETEPTS